MEHVLKITYDLEFGSTNKAVRSRKRNHTINQNKEREIQLVEIQLEGSFKIPQ